MKVENMDLLENSLTVVALKTNDDSAGSHTGLIKAFNNLDLNDGRLLRLDQKSGENKNTQCLFPLSCTQKYGKDYVVDNCCESLAKDDTKSKSKVKIQVKSSVAELIEIPEIDTPVDREESIVSKKETSGEINYIKSEEDLSTVFSELSLDKKSSCVSGSHNNEDNQDKSSSEDLSEEVRQPTLPCVNGVLLKEEESADNGSQAKHISENLLAEKICGLTVLDVNSTFLKKEENAVLVSKKSEERSENKLLYPSDELDEEDLVERGSTKKSPDDERKERKIKSGRTEKTVENATNYLKHFPKLHMSGGLLVDPSPNKTLNAANGYFNLVPFDDSSGQSNNFVGSSVQASSLPVFFDPNPINPIAQGSVDNSYSFPMSHESNNLLYDVFSLPSGNNDSGTPLTDVQNRSTAVLEAQNQKDASSRQSTSTYDCLEDFLSYPSPVSEISSYLGQRSRSTSPESGYCSSPRFSPLSDDSYEQCKYKDKQPLNSCTSVLEINSPPPCVPNENEFIDNWDFSIFDFDSTSCGIQPADEEKERINVIKQDLKKCEELCKAVHSNTAGHSECDTFSMSFKNPDSQNSLNSSFGMNSLSLQGHSVQPNVIQQQQLSNVNTVTQVPSAQVNTPPVLVIYVPYAVNGTDKGSKPFKPIEPHPEGKRLLARSPRQCLKAKLDRKKQMDYLYKITERLQNGNKDVIYIENTETRQTNLHLAVIKQDMELAYCLLELHKQSTSDLSIVNCRDIHRKTALQYAIKNVMTVFVEYLKDYGAK